MLAEIPDTYPPGPPLYVGARVRHMWCDFGVGTIIHWADRTTYCRSELWTVKWADTPRHTGTYPPDRLFVVEDIEQR
jgi:hypothetical protein